MSLPTEERLKEVKSHIQSIPDFPKTGILFRDVFPVLRKPKIFQMLVDLLVENVINEVGSDIDAVIGLDARGFLFGPLVALRLNCSFVPVRKAGKLPGKCVKASYVLEYGKDEFEMQSDAIKPGDKVVIVDDLIATGGSMLAAVNLVEKLGGTVKLCLVIIELAELKGRDKLASYKFNTLIEF